MSRPPGLAARAAAAALAAALGLMSGPVAARQELRILAEADPPFVTVRDGVPGGPYIESLRALLAREGLSLQVSLMPRRRISVTLPVSPGSCGLALNFSPGEAETFSYVGRVAPVKLAVYALRQAPRVGNIEELRPYRIGAVDMAELRDFLTAADIAFEPISPAAQRLGMLQRKRFDYLVSDDRPEMFEVEGADQVRRVFVLAQVDRWLACHPGLSPRLLATLRQALQEGLFAESLRPIWDRAGLGRYFDRVRLEWELIPKAAGAAASRRSP